MNVVIEYLLRNDRIEQMLSLPCSLFLENKKQKIALTLTPGYGNSDIVVRQYDICETTTLDLLPPYKESMVAKDQVFRSPNTILDYKLLEFTEQIFKEEKQVAELPMSAVQERRYNDHISNFFNPKCLNQFRENWLWNCFYEIYVPIEIKGRFKIYSRPEMNREILTKKNKSCLKVWEVWKKTLLLNSNPCSELIFAKYYRSKFLTRKISDVAYDDIMSCLK